MNTQTARLFVLGTGLLAMVSVSVALLLGLRLRETRAEMAELQEEEDVCNWAASEGAPR
jgi:NAD/NADP transhydrogenase alpha subunit